MKSFSISGFFPSRKCRDESVGEGRVFLCACRWKMKSFKSRMKFYDAAFVFFAVLRARQGGEERKKARGTIVDELSLFSFCAFM